MTMQCEAIVNRGVLQTTLEVSLSKKWRKPLSGELSIHELAYKLYHHHFPTFKWDAWFIKIPFPRLLKPDA